jgi:hypothetical protein
MLLRLLGYQQITDLSAAVGFTSVPLGASYVRFQGEGYDVRWRDDATDPTSAVGMLLSPDLVVEYEGALAGIKFIEAVAGATLNCTFYGYQDVTLTGETVDSFELVSGDDYYYSDGRQLEWSEDDWPDLTGATVTLRISTGGTLLSVAGTVVTAGVAVTQLVRFELSDTNTAALNPGGHSWEVAYTKGSSTVRLVGGTCSVRKAVA